MGLSISQSLEVFFDSERELRLNTSISSNPQSRRYSGVLTYSIFLRLHSRSNYQDQRGDGNPLIYALKGMNGFTISEVEWHKFRENQFSILDKIIEKIECFSGLICIPSSKSVVLNTALDINSRCSSPKEIFTDCFYKLNAREVYDDLLIKRRHVKSKHKREYSTELAKLLAKIENDDLSFSIKYIHRDIRPYVTCLGPLSIMLDPTKKYILVDDLISSGSSLSSAIDILCDYGIPKENLMVIVLLSQI